MDIPPLTLPEVEQKIRDLYEENEIERGDAIASLDTLLCDLINDQKPCEDDGE